MQRKFALYVVSRLSLCRCPLSSFSESRGVARHFAHFLICTFRTNINDFHSGTKRLISQCNIRLNVTVAVQFFAFEYRIIEHIVNGPVRKYLAW